MSFLGIEFNDAAIAGISEGRTVFVEPGCALIADGQLLFGHAALAEARKTPRGFHDRYWRDLSEQPVNTGMAELASYADVAHAQLQRLWQDSGASADAVGFAVPFYWNRDQLALLLGIAEEIGMPVAGITETAVAATRRSYPVKNLLHIEMYAHATVLSSMKQEGGAEVASNELVENLGNVSLRRSCAEFFARRFLDCSRFDPLHAAGSEQQVYDQLDDWIAQQPKTGETQLRLSFEGNEFSAQAASAQLAESLRLRCQPLVQALRSRLDAEAATVLQVGSGLAGYPGVLEILQELPGCTVFVLEPAAAARGLDARHAHLQRQEQGISLSKLLPWDQPAAELASPQSSAAARAELPSHLLLDGIAYRLGGAALRIGAEAPGDGYALVVDPRHAAVSRQHCSIEADAGRVLLTDHSRYGTMLNGHRVAGSAVLQAGDVISIGEPACELRLLTEIVPDGA
jgi:hypothetical protein